MPSHITWYMILCNICKNNINYTLSSNFFNFIGYYHAIAFLYQSYDYIYIYETLFFKCFEIKVVIKFLDQTNKICKSNYNQNLNNIYFISMVTTQPNAKGI